MCYRGICTNESSNMVIAERKRIKLEPTTILTLRLWIYAWHLPHRLDSNAKSRSPRIVAKIYHERFPWTAAIVNVWSSHKNFCVAVAMYPLLSHLPASPFLFLIYKTTIVNETLAPRTRRCAKKRGITCRISSREKYLTRFTTKRS